jgi:hypothetical protein
MSKHQHKFRPLNHDEQIELAKIIRQFVPLARSEGHFLHKWAKGHIADLLWCWTASAIKLQSGRVKNDAYKYDVRVHPATAKAMRVVQTKSIKQLRHEHAIPRSLLAQRIVDKDMNEEGIVDFLRKHCHAAIVLDSEDGQLDKARLRKKMPENWDWESGDAYARYKEVGLLDALTWPPGHPCAR